MRLVDYTKISIFASGVCAKQSFSEKPDAPVVEVPMTDKRLSMIRFILAILGVWLCVIYAYPQEYRTYDGTQNNLTNNSWGAAGSQLLRITDVAYQDSISSPAGIERPNPRKISNYLFHQDENIFDQLNLSDFVWVFGQFIDHDISLTENNPAEPLMITVPDDDEYFSPGSGIFMFRSEEFEGTGTSPQNPRQHPNGITSFIDASVIYGSDPQRANWLRTFENGKLKTSEGNLLPWNTTTGEFNSPKDPSAPFMADDTFSGTKLFVAGDIRANENPLLISFHTLFVREHNRICDKVKAKYSDWNDEQIYQHARKWVGAFLQRIVYFEWLPAMGVNVPVYNGYNSDIEPSIFNVFSAAAFRLGHTLINSNIIRMSDEGSEISLGNISLKDAFFNPVVINLAGGIDPYLKGMATQVQQELDCKMINDVRNFLFGTPGAGGLDLAAININRGRERGLSDYNTVRKNFGLPGVSSFMEITSDAESAALLENLYENVDNVDPWVGMLAEYHMPDALFGELVMTVIEKQFQTLRDGDRFYFENDPEFTPEDIAEIQSTTMQHVIMRNSNISLMQENVFLAMPHEEIPNGPILEESVLDAVVYPNPTQGDITVKLYLAERTLVNVRIFDMNGRLVVSESTILEAGNNFLQYALHDHKQRGIYNILIDAGYEYKVLRAVRE